MAGEPARALVTGGGARPASLFCAHNVSFRLIALRLAPRHSGIGELIFFSLDTEKSWSKVRVLGTLVIHINLVSLCFWNVMRPLIEEFHCKQKVFGKPRLRPFFEGM
jgi:hypothetical protein